MSVLYLLVFLLAWCWYETTHYRMVSCVIPLRSLKESFRIVQISDFHSNRAVSPKCLAEDIGALKPDLIFFTGDLLDRRDKTQETVLQLLDSLEELQIPMAFVPGNHEMGSGLGRDLIRRMEERGIHPLHQKPLLMKHIRWMGSRDRIKEDSSDDLRILVTHNPMDGVREADAVDLILSGHTHGGQVRLPLIGPLRVPGQRWFPPYSRGLYHLSKASLYVDSGLGNTFLPLRFFCPIQFSILELVPETEQK